MTSQKRYRQHQESNKNNSRFRDLPPRFKRQKSVPSAAPSPTATPLPAEAHTGKSSVAQVAADTQLNTKINHLPAVTKTESLQQASPPMAPSTTNVFPVEENHSSKLRPGADVFEPPVSPATWQWPAKSNPFILSQRDNRQFNRASNIQPLPISLGTHFGYKLDSPPLSPWTGRHAANFAGQFGMPGCSPWMSPASDICTGQGIQCPPSVYYNNENWAPNQNLMYPHSPGGSWGKPTTQRLYNTPLQLQQEHATVSSRYVDNHGASGRNSMRLPVDYTDPDIRTIEMLRELERVADEKESEDFGVDRKSLVSHHLRMLMCAVDKYTEGIEDGFADISRNDEVSLASSESTPRVSPSPFAVKEKQAKINTKEAKPESSSSLWTPGNDQPQWNTSEIEHASSVASQQALRGCKSPLQQAVPMQGCKSPLQQAVPLQGCKSLLQQAVPLQGCKSPLQQVVPMQGCKPLQQTSPRTEQPNSIKVQNEAWDLWSSPSFDFSGVLNQNLDELTRNPFSRLKDNDEEERKPLYRR